MNAGVTLKLQDGTLFELEQPPAGAGESYFLVGLPKAGSTLFFRIMAPIAKNSGASWFSLANTLHQKGVGFDKIEAGLDDVFRPSGYAYGGFRGVPKGVELPAFAKGRTVGLVRDPRDMLSSLYFSEGISHKPPGAEVSTDLREEFDERRRFAQSTGIDAFALGRASRLTAVYRRAVRQMDQAEAKLFRYEDVVFEKERWIREVCDHLSLDVKWNVAKNIIARNDVVRNDEAPKDHIRRVAPGDHKEKFAPETIAALNEEFRDILDRFGYEAG